MPFPCSKTQTSADIHLVGFWLCLCDGWNETWSINRMTSLVQKDFFLNEDNKKLPDKFRWIMRTSCRWTNVDYEPLICSFSIFWAVQFWTGILDIRDGMIPPLTQKKYMFSRWFHPIVHWHIYIYIYIFVSVYVYIYVCVCVCVIYWKRTYS